MWAKYSRHRISEVQQASNKMDMHSLNRNGGSMVLFVERHECHLQRSKPTSHAYVWLQNGSIFYM